MSSRFLEILNVHATLKAKIVRGNDNKHSLINNTKKLFIPKPSWEIKYTKILWKKTKWYIKVNKFLKNYLKKLTEKVLITCKIFWKFMKRFLTNKGFIANNDIILIHKSKIISDRKQLEKLFNSCYLNIVW